MTTPEQRQKLTEIINAGLVSGLGNAKAGHLCVEAAICLAMGESHSDRPSCVAEPDRDFAIRINDAMWPSPEARAKALLPLALAQLGTAGRDRGPWVQRVAEGTIRQILPIALRAASKVHPDEERRAALEGAAIRCEQDGTGAAAAAAAVAADAADATDAAAAADSAVDAADAAVAATVAAGATVAAAARDNVLRLAVQIALDAYAAEGRTP